MDYKNMKPGYQGVKDDMRDMAYEMATGKKPAYKKGGACYAEGGAAKVRRGEASANGTPIGPKKGCNKKVK